MFENVSKNKAIAGQTGPLSSTHMSKKDDITRHIGDPTTMNKRYLHKKKKKILQFLNNLQVYDEKK